MKLYNTETSGEVETAATGLWSIAEETGANMSNTSVLEQFKWECQPAAEKFVTEKVDTIQSKIPESSALSLRLLNEASVRFADMIDTILLHVDDANRDELRTAGWTRETDSHGFKILTNELGMFPSVALNTEQPRGTVCIDLKVEFVSDFLATNDLQRKIMGEPLSQFRCAVLWEKDGFTLAAMERHGLRGYEPDQNIKPTDVLAVHESFRLRPRFVEDDEVGFKAAHELIDTAIAKIGKPYTCDLWFSAEREYWMKRNLAGRTQKARQDRLGIGWANHDHHTYRSSREMFPRLVSVWEKLGFHCRERFYAGMEAGWGAQVMEEPITGIITFNDVDMSPEELMGDFSHEGFSEKRDKLGTVGLWCGLHGEAFLQAGMHHLEAQFDFDLLREGLEREFGIKTMKPFTNFEFLTQAFTEGERWKVDPARIEKLLAKNYITPEQGEQFLVNGALGSHLENLERNQGFKGFNQQGVSEIIAATDPRKHAGRVMTS
jgi:hypothetical protein